MNIEATTVSITSFNAHNINDGTNYKARFPVKTPVTAKAEVVEVERGSDTPVDSGTKIKGVEYTVVINVIAGSVETLKQWFDTGARTPYKLIVTDSSDSKSWYVYARCTDYTVEGRPDSPIFRAKLHVSDNIWRNNSSTVETWTATSSPDTHSWSVAGTKYALPIITINPQSARAGGFTYKRFVVMYNQTNTAFTNYPVNILGGNVDHATLVGAGKAQADGDDWRIFMDGTEVINKWPGGGGYNSATLRTFCNINLAPKVELTLGDTIAGAGAVTTITFQLSNANRDALQKLQSKENKLLYIGTELFTFTDVNILTLSVTGCARQAKGSSAGAHAVGDTVRWIEHDIWVAYGDSTVTAPSAADDNLKPMLDLTNSTNSSWVRTDYFSIGTLRTAQFIPRVVSSLWSKTSSSTARTELYGANHATNPNLTAIASEMGMSIKAGYVTIWRTEQAELEWRLTCPALISSVTVSGEKYRYATSWPTLALEATNSTSWTSIWTEATPASAQTWTNLSVNGTPTALGANYSSIRFAFYGTVTGTASNLAHAELDSLTHDLVYPPSITLGAEAGEYFVDVRVENNTTGDYIDLRWLAATNSAITINCDTKTVTDAEGTNIRGALTVPETRHDWLTLEPGTNEIITTETGLADVDLTFTYEERSL